MNCIFTRAIRLNTPPVGIDECTSLRVLLLDHTRRLIHQTNKVVAMNRPLKVFKVVHQTVFELQVFRVSSQIDVCVIVLVLRNRVLIKADEDHQLSTPLMVYTPHLLCAVNIRNTCKGSKQLHVMRYPVIDVIRTLERVGLTTRPHCSIMDYLCVVLCTVPIRFKLHDTNARVAESLPTGTRLHHYAQ